MKKQQHIKITVPKWKWWQTTIAILVVIIAFRTDATLLLELLKMWLKKSPCTVILSAIALRKNIKL